MSCHSCHVSLCHVMSCHVMSCHVMSCHVMSCHVMSCHVMSCLFMSCCIIVRYIILTVHVLHQKLFGVLHDWQVIVMLRYLAGKHLFFTHLWSKTRLSILTLLGIFTMSTDLRFFPEQCCEYRLTCRLTLQALLSLLRCMVCFSTCLVCAGLLFHISLHT